MTEAKHSPLLPCPFCGETDIDPGFWASTYASGPGCSACGATATDAEDWNKRTATSLHHELVAALETMASHFESASSGFIGGCKSDQVWCEKQDDLIASARALVQKAKQGDKP